MIRGTSLTFRCMSAIQLRALRAGKPSLILGPILLIVLGVAACGNSQPSDATRDVRDVRSKPALPSLDPNRPAASQLSRGQVEGLKRQALSGDPESAILLRRYFAELSPMNRAEVDRWTQVAAENGSSVGASILAASLGDLGGEENCLRKKFWLERAIQLNPNDAALVTTATINLSVLAENWDGCVARGKSAAEH